MFDGTLQVYCQTEFISVKIRLQGITTETGHKRSNKAFETDAIIK